MALNTFGWTPAEVTQDSAGNVVAGVTLTVFTDMTKATQVTGLYGKDGVTPIVNDVVVSDTHGRFGFKASDTYSLLYVWDGSSADPWPVAAHEALDAGVASHAQAVAAAQAAADSAAQSAAAASAPADSSIAAAVNGASTQTRAALNASYANGRVNLRSMGLSDATTDLRTVLDSAVAAGWKHIVIPYRAAAWPMTSKFVATGLTLECEPGARISFNMTTADFAMELTDSKLLNVSITSPYAGPITSANQADYGDHARSIRMRGSAVVENFYGENAAWAPVDFEDDANHVRVRNYTVSNLHHYKGWAAAVHVSGSKDVKISNVVATNCDRGVEVETGAVDVAVDNGILTNIYPPGYTGQPADYSTYSFGIGAHSHAGEGACRNISYRNWRLTDCGGGIIAALSSGSAASDIPASITFDNVVIEGYRNIPGQYNAVHIGGSNVHARNVRFLPGSGVSVKASVWFDPQASDSSVEINEAQANAYSTPFVKLGGGGVSANNRVKLAKIGAPANPGVDWLVDVLAPRTTVEFDLDQVTGTLGYVRFQTAAAYSVMRGFFRTAAGETFVSPLRVSGAKNCRVSGTAVPTVLSKPDVYVTTSTTGLVITDFTSERSGNVAFNLDATTSGCTIGAVAIGAGTITNAGTNNKIPA